MARFWSPRIPGTNQLTLLRAGVAVCGPRDTCGNLKLHGQIMCRTEIELVAKNVLQIKPPRERFERTGKIMGGRGRGRLDNNRGLGGGGGCARGQGL